MTPRISVLMSVFNGERYLAGAIRSVLSQTFDDFELILVNDGSTDQSREIMRSMEDSRIRILDQENRGLTASLNRAATHARGEFLARQDADDLSDPERFARQLELMDEMREVVAMGSDRLWINEKGEVLWRPILQTTDYALRAVFPLTNPFCHGSMLLRRVSFEKVGGYDSNYRYSQDYELWWRLGMIGQLCNYPQALYSHRRHGSAITSREAVGQEVLASEARLGILRDWLGLPPGFTHLVRQRLADPWLLPGVKDERAEERKKHYSRVLAFLAVALCLSKRPCEAKWAFGEADRAAGGWSRARVAALLNRVAPELFRRLLKIRARKNKVLHLYLDLGDVPDA